PIFFFSFFTTPPPPTTLYPLSLHDALPICEAGALVIAFVTLPFTFEGKRRNAQAREALARLIEVAHSVICFENDRMGDIVAPHRSEEHTSELQSRFDLVCRLLLEKKKQKIK